MLKTITIQESNTNATPISFLQFKDFEESNVTQKIGKPFRFNLELTQENQLRGDETEIKFEINHNENAISTTITNKSTIKKQIKNSEVIRMLESWLQEESTQEDIKLWEELEADLKNEPICFSEIDAE